MQHNGQDNIPSYILDFLEDTLFAALGSCHVINRFAVSRELESLHRCNAVFSGK